MARACAQAAAEGAAGLTIVSKRKDSAYRSGRSPDWLKMKDADAPAVRRQADLSIKSAFEDVARGWLLLAEQMEWIDGRRSSLLEDWGR